MKRIICTILCLAAFLTCFSAFADEGRVFILCNPKTPVNVRRTPKKGSEIIGRLDFGDWVDTDFKKKNGYLHVYGITEENEGWIFAGYVVEDQPVKLEKAWASIGATGRVKTYRWINGIKNCWVNICDQVKVFGMSQEWAVTDHGYIRTKYLEVWYE